MSSAGSRCRGRDGFEATSSTDILPVWDPDVERKRREDFTRHQLAERIASMLPADWHAWGEGQRIDHVLEEFDRAGVGATPARAETVIAYLRAMGVWD